MVNEPPDPRQNHLLEVLPPTAYERLRPHLEMVSLKLGQVLYESGGQMEHVYFPTNAIVSLLYVTEHGHCAEIPVVRNQAAVIVALFISLKTMPRSREALAGLQEDCIFLKVLGSYAAAQRKEA